MKKDAALNVILLLLAGATVGGYVMGRLCARMHPPVTPVQTDTVIVVRRDTVTVFQPVPVSTVPSGFELVKVGTLAQLTAQLEALKHDADFWACNPDTVWYSVPVPIETKDYKGEDYEATVSGYHPKLETITVFPKTVTVYTTQTVEKPVPYRWTVSPFVGADIGHETFAARIGIMADYAPKRTAGGLSWAEAMRCGTTS